MVEVERIFDGRTRSQAKTITIRIDREIAERLENMNKGSYNAALKHLLALNPDNQLKRKVEGLEERLDKIEGMIDKLISYNKLRC